MIGLSRRDFTTGILTALGGTLLSGAASSENPVQNGGQKPPPKRNIPLGFDNFSVRAWGWNADQLLDYAIRLKVDSVLFSNLEVFDSFEDPYLRGLRDRAEARGIKIQVGTVSLCPSSEAFNPKFGSAEEHLSLLLQVAEKVGSPVARCYLGHGGDRVKGGGIRVHIDNMIKVIETGKDQALRSGVKIAIENHAGDLQAWELAELIEKAGKDFVGATMDSGNSVWTLEDPLAALEILGPYAATTGMRDSAVWQSPDGAQVQWTNMGRGQVDWNRYMDRFQELCPGVAFQLEIISGGPRGFDYYKPEFWQAFPEARARDLAGFVRMAANGKPPVEPEGTPSGKDEQETSRLKQSFDLEQSLSYCREVLGLGLS